MNTNDDFVLVKSNALKTNALVDAMSDLGLQELRFLAFAASRLPHDLKAEKGKPYDMEIDVPALVENFGINPQDAYREIKILADRLTRKIIEFDDESGAEIAVGLLSNRKYDHGKGRLWFRFDENLLPHLMGLTERFTKHRIKDVYQFQKPSTWRVYELLRQYKEIGKQEFEIEELHWKLGLADKYPRLVDLRKWILDPAILEINAASDILVDYSQKKRGRRIVALIFHILENKGSGATTRKSHGTSRKPSVSAQSPQDSALVRMLREEYRVSPKQSRQLAELGSHDNGFILDLLPKLRLRWEQATEKKTTLGTYISKALREELLHKNSLIGN
ncbi:Initiator Replication protein [Desulfonatronum thiosulfatophilum]|uniref:Initiator Replication protein n=1 Tax=Desulfonatronum thiosulfatophilum TaxID=617002 RepID=A0A1G6E8D9_9BACT|nr:replication initiation protein [Desulfonatronum thiosulfatophilum]SDB53686.1 Initiator Replication protein [Desulfonatronum thiosulfatophilum]